MEGLLYFIELVSQNILQNYWLKYTYQEYEEYQTHQKLYILYIQYILLMSVFITMCKALLQNFHFSFSFNASNHPEFDM